MNLTKLLITSFSLILLVSSCTQETTEENNSKQDNTQNITIAPGNNAFRVSGVASKGPIQNATVEIYALDNNGIVTGSVLASTTTDENGAWEVSFTTAPTQATVIIVSGGSYIDEADPAVDKRIITLAPTESLQGILFPGFSTASVSMLTHALLEKSRNETSASNFHDVLNNNRNSATLALGFDPFTVTAANPLSPSASASLDSIEYAMYLGGLATALNSAAIILGQPVADYAIMMGMVEDLSDGNLNGKKLSATVQVMIDGVATDFPDSIDLNLAILRFRNNNYAAYAVTDVQEIVEVNETILAVPGTNNSPNAMDDSASTISGVSILINNLLSNDTDPDGDSLVVSSYTQPTNGTVTEGAAGNYTFEPDSGFTGNTIFSYVASDNRGGEDTAQVIINVSPAPTTGTEGIDPTANAGSDLEVDEETVVNFNGALSLDADGFISTYAWAQVAGPSVTINNADSATPDFISPTTTSVETLVFSLTVTDNDGLTDSDSISVIVNPVNVLPVADAGGDQPLAQELSTITLDATASSDSDGSISSYQWIQVSGTPVTLTNADADIATFTSPEVLISNVDILVFQLQVMDNNNGEDDDYITIITNPVLNPPVSNAGSDQTLNESDGTTSVIVTLDGSLSSDDRSITAYSWSQIAGTPMVTLDDSTIESPSFTAPDIANDTTFTFQLSVTDDEGGININTDTNTVDINLLSLNTGPVVVDDTGIVTDEDSPVTITTLLDNDSDPESNSFTIDSVVQPANGTVVIETGNTSVTYTPDADFNGSDSFTYIAVDEFGAFSTAPATVNVTINGVNDDPVAVDDSGTVTQGFPITFTDIVTNDTDLEGDTLSVTGVTQPANGVSVNNGDGTVSYTPDLSFNGTDSFTYHIVDGNGGNADGTITVTVIADTDGDGVIDTVEITDDSTDPTLADSDNDGFFDGHEKAAGTNPNDNTDMPATTIISTGNANNVISVDTDWTLNNSPYWLQSDVSIQTGATLTIHPGVIVKSNLNVDMFVNTGGILNASGNAPVPQHVVFTSSLDDSINGDTNGDGVATTASDNDWGGVDYNQGSAGTIHYGTVKNAGDCIGIYNSSPIIDHVEIGDCQYYGIDFQSTSSTNTANLSYLTLNDYDANGQSTGYSGVRLYSSGSSTAILNVDNITMNEPGTSGYYGLSVYGTGGNISGSIDTVSIINAANDGININNAGNGTFDIALSNLSVDGSGANSMDVRNSSSGSLLSSFDGSNSFLNAPITSSSVYFEQNDPDFLLSSDTTIDTAGYGLNLNGSNGNFNNITIDNMTVAGVVLSNASDPAVFSNIILTNSDSPYQLNGQNITSTILAGYDFSDASVNKSYIRIGGTLLNDMTLTPDPLATGSSVWRVFSTMTVPAGLTMTVDDGAVLKIDDNLIFHIYGSLVVGDGDGAGAKAIFTSILDDDISAGGDSNGDGTATGPAWNNWNYIHAHIGSVIDMDNAIVRFNQYGIYQYNEQSTSLDITNTSFNDIYYYGLHLRTFTGQDITWNLDNVSFTDTGVNTSYHGIYIQTNNDSTFTGSLNNVTMNNIGGNGILIDDNSTGIVNPVISGLTIGDTGTVGQYGVDIQGDATTTPTFDASSGSGNNISGGSYNLLLRGVGGNYSNLTLDGATTAPLYFSGTPAIASWDDNTVILTGSTTPYLLTTTLPSSVGTLGTADLGYNQVSSTADVDFIKIGGTLSNTTLPADPLGANTQYYVNSTLTVPASTTLTVNDGAVIKFPLNTYLQVDGNLVVGDGVAGGAKAIFTSFRDTTVGTDIGDGTAAARESNSHYIRIGEGSNLNIDNAEIRFAQYGLYQWFTSPAAVTVSNTDFSNIYYHGIEMNNNTGDSGTLDLQSVTFDTVGVNTSYHAIYLNIDNDATFSGTWNDVTINNTGGDGILIDDDSTDTVDPLISGLITGNTGTIGQYAVDIQGDATTTPTFDASSGSGNNISGGSYNLLLRGVGGNYSNLTLDGATIAPLYFSAVPSITSWDDNTVILTGSTTPYLLTTNLPPIVGTLGTADLGYNQVSSSVTEESVKIAGTTNNLTLPAEPLGTNTQYYVHSTMTVPTGVTLTVDDGAVIKFPLGTYLQVDGNLVVGDGVAGGAKAIFTSFRDNTVGIDISDGTAAARESNSHYIRIGDGSDLNIDNAEIRFAQYGLYQWYTSPAAITVSNTDFSNIYYHGIEMNNNTGDSGTLDLQSVTFDTVGINTSYHTIYLNIDNDATFTGIWNDVTINNTGGDGILIDDDSTGIVDPLISGLTIGNTGTIGQYGVDIQGDSTTTPTFDASSGSGNNISGGSYNLLLRGVGGNYSDLTLDGASIAAIYFSANTSPASWASVVIDNAPTPFYVSGMNLPAIVTYTAGSAGLLQTYIAFSGTLVSDMTLLPDPIGAGSVWYMAKDTTIPASFTMTLVDNTIIKSSDGVDLFVEGTLNVTAGSATQAVFTDFRDDTHGGDTNDDGVSSGSSANNWQGIDFRAGSLGIIDNLIVDYAETAVYIRDAGNAAGLSFTNLEINNCVDGLHLYQSSTTVNMEPEFDGLSINECSSEHMYLEASSTTSGPLLQPVFTGSLSLTDITGSTGNNGIYCKYAGPNMTISGFTISGMIEGVDLDNNCSITVENSLIRNATNIGVNLRTTGSPIIRNNIIVNNGFTGSNDSGIYANSGTNAFINNNVIRHNQGDFGAGIMVRDSSPTIQNNLIVENIDATVNVYGGSGVFVWNNSSPTILNNTIAHNTSVTTTQGGGIHIETTGGNTVTLSDNIIYGNIDGTSSANDVYYAGAGAIVENFNLIGEHNGTLIAPGANDILATDPLFTDGWYLTVDALDGGGSDSPAIDTGSVLAGNTALGAGTVVLTAKTTRTDGTNEGAGSQVDIGYHYPDSTSAPVINASNTQVVIIDNVTGLEVEPATHDENPNSGGTIITMIIRPKDDADIIVGAGLQVIADVGAAEENHLSNVTDLGDGSYHVTYTIPTGTSGATVSFTVNGIAITADAVITWTL